MADVTYNPDFDPTGIEGGLDTNTLPWIDLSHAPGMSYKPMRVSPETSMFSLIIRLKKGTVQPSMIHLGAMDFMILSGKMTFPDGPLAGTVEEGIFGFIPANTMVEGLVANEDTEYLGNFYGPIAFLGPDNKTIKGLFSGPDVKSAANKCGLTLIPTTLAECMQPKPEPYKGPAEPLAFSSGSTAWARMSGTEADAPKALLGPHFVDTKKLPWIVNPDTPDVGLKIMRVSEETGMVSLIVKHNGVAPPHYHLGASDFFVLSGSIGYRAGPPEGYSPGTWVFEPAGARHESTQRIGDDDLVYFANVYGPIQFDGGKDTPIAFVLSWMGYKAMADGANNPLIQSKLGGDEHPSSGWTSAGTTSSGTTSDKCSTSTSGYNNAGVEVQS
jgi:quercetin dioxygenase-like cupin family protein